MAPPVQIVQSTSSTAASTVNRQHQLGQPRTRQPVPGQGHGGGGRFSFEESSDEEDEKKQRTKSNNTCGEDLDEPGGTKTERKTTTGGTVKGVVGVDDDYTGIIDEYAGEWRETMFFGEPED